MQRPLTQFSRPGTHRSPRLSLNRWSAINPCGEGSNSVSGKVMCEVVPLMFKDAFWSSEFMCHVGYEAMIQRLRDGRQMCKDVEELLKMRALAEEKYGKELVTLARKAGGHTEISTLRTSFEQLKSQIENVGNFHIQLSDILKEEVRKIDLFRERQREQRRKFQSIMEKLQRKKICLYKKTMESKKNYEQRCKDATEAERAAERTSATSKTDKIRQRIKQFRQTAKEAEKLHFTNVNELENARHDWEETHRSTCEVFQQMEGDRIRMLRCALWDHCNHFSLQSVKDDEYFEEVRRVLERCDITKDINCFIEMKTTGSRPPEPILFEICHWMETSTNGNCQSLSLGNDSTRSFNPVLASSSGSVSVSSLQNLQTSLTSIDERETSEDAYAPLKFKSSQARSQTDEDKYTVLYEYNAQVLDELSVNRGEVVQVLERGEDGWWTVEKNGQTGLVPGNYLEKQ
ncbi:proline-serine-threonine phosphatase-interacting protein 1b [Nelusetta ayraudi]|uniref:proline-serine-threonine phosphatase-interacting protein 1b n=1 Tax=Nelusetta ayraudi TaxID=303726 RepID=UPI003F70C00A